LIRNSSKILEKDIDLGDTTFTIGTTLKSNFNINIIKAAYDFSFYMDDRINLGLYLGLYLMPLYLTEWKWNSKESRLNHW